MDIIQHAKQATKMLPTKAIGLTYLLMVGWNMYQNEGELPELMLLASGFISVMFFGYVMLEIVMGLSKNPYIDVAVLGALSYILAGVVQVFFKLIDYNVFSKEEMVSALIFGGVAAAVMYAMRKWRLA